MTCKCGQVRAQRRAEREGDAEAHADERHGRASLAVVADVGRNSHCKLHIALAQASHNATGKERPEIGRCNPQRYAEDVAHHRPQKRRAPAIFV